MISVIDDYIKFVKGFLYDYYKLLLDKDYDKKLVEPFIERYIEIRYYNDWTLVNSRNFVDKITKELTKIVSELIIDSNADTETIKNIFALFAYVLYFDDVSEYTSVSLLIKSLFENENIKLQYSEETKNNVTDLIHNFMEKKSTYFKLFDLKEFKIKTKRIKRNLFFTDLEQFCNISRLYSDYAINKAYNSGVVYENKYYLLYVLLSQRVLMDIVNQNYGCIYVVDFPVSLFGKSKKINRYLNVIKNEICRERIHLYIKYFDYLENKDLINSFITKGYRIDVELDEYFMDDYDSLVLFSNVFVYEKYDYYDMIIDSRDSIKANIITL